MAKIYAKAIHAGAKKLSDVPTRWKEATKTAYFELYGEECPEE